jgi:hypothetical protein
MSLIVLLLIIMLALLIMVAPGILRRLIKSKPSESLAQYEESIKGQLKTPALKVGGEDVLGED